MLIMNSGNDVQVGYSCKDWERHYEEKDLRWDLEEVAPPFVRLWKERKILPCKAIVPGCGAGHEAIFLAEQGFQVTAVDYTHGAVSLLKEALEKRKLLGEVLRYDFFKLDSKYNESFDLIIDTQTVVIPTIILKRGQHYVNVGNERWGDPNTKIYLD